jgi:hypothetical protein
MLTNLTLVPAMAGVIVEYLGPLNSSPTLDVVPQGDFIMGHTGDPANIITDPVVYMYYSRCSILNPFAYGCTCLAGYTVNSYGLVFAKIGGDTFEVHLPMSLGHSYELSLYPPGTVCFDPPGLVGRYQIPFYCLFDEAFTVTLEGFYKVTLAAAGDCDCISMSYTQALHVPLGYDHWGSELFLVTDENPGHCPDYIVNPNMGYLWYTEIDAPGNIVMWADATCCENPVSVDRESWGGVKALYR